MELFKIYFIYEFFMHDFFVSIYFCNFVDTAMNHRLQMLQQSVGYLILKRLVQRLTTFSALLLSAHHIPDFENAPSPISVPNTVNSTTSSASVENSAHKKA
mmetsp:Transcript_1683/g.3566  ORF Transcript_1683/g.3566 Transcript_1683/m.3566 type:complete len:101 (+) Transcript_1683:17-319(+)